MSDMDTCIYCNGRTGTHCDSAGCCWQRCTECDTILWPSAGRALRRGKSVAWPYYRPDPAAPDSAAPDSAA